MVLQIVYCLSFFILFSINAVETNGVLGWVNLGAATFFGVVGCIVLWQETNK